jgi:hypothetical protein
MQTASAELYHTALKAHEVIFRADTIFPFTLFPDTVTLDREKITIANRFFFRVARIVSSQIEDIQGIEADVGPFFGTVKVTSKFFASNLRVVRFLSRGNAIELRRLIQGFIIAKQKGIDCSKIDKEHLIVLLHEIGKMPSEES